MAEPILAPDPTPAQPVDRDLFSLHPEESMTERPSHRRQGNYLARALRRLLRGWFVAANMGVYWVPGQMEHPFAGPDVLVARGRPAREDSAVYLTYEDGPLTLVVEVASPATRSLDLRKRDTDYAVALGVPWYLWIDLPRRVLELYRLVEGRYERVRTDEDGRVWCPDLEVGFCWQPDRQLVRVFAADGSVVPTEEEEEALLQEETARRQTAEQRATREARRAEREAAARRAAERQATALAAELERLRRALEAGEDKPA